MRVIVALILCEVHVVVGHGRAVRRHRHALGMADQSVGIDKRCRALVP